jgi:hypothetical protein
MKKDDKLVNSASYDTSGPVANLEEPSNHLAPILEGHYGITSSPEPVAQTLRSPYPEASDALPTICLADVAPKPVDWLWHPYIARGCVTMLDGDPGLGKSHVTLALATALSNGSPLPNQDTGILGKTLLVSCEDDLAYSVKPRLVNLGANCDLIHSHPSIFTLDEDGVRKLCSTVAKIAPILVIIDPLFAYLGAKVDANAANKVRAILAPLSEMAAVHKIAILCVRHLNKGSANQSLLYRGMGSIDFVAAARSGLTVMQSPEDESMRVILHTKTNIGPKGSSIGFTFQDDHFKWLGKVAISEKDFLFEKATEGTHRSTKGLEAEEFLRSMLGFGPKPSILVLKEAQDAGISNASLQRAKDRLGIMSKKGRGDDTSWTWELPHRQLVTSPPANHEDLDQLEYVDDEPDVDGFLQHLQDIQDSHDLAQLGNEHLKYLENTGTEQ